MRKTIGAVLAATLAVTLAGCAAQPADGFDRAAAETYLDAHWNDPAHIRISVGDYQLWSADDCAFFASSVLWAAGLPQTVDWTAATYDVGRLATKLDYPGPTRSVMLADELEQYLLDAGLATQHQLSFDEERVADAAVGDLVTYDWNDNGVIDHVSVVRSTDETDGPHIAQHNPNREDQPRWWSSEHGAPIAKAYPGAKAYLIHIVG